MKKEEKKPQTSEMCKIHSNVPEILGKENYRSHNALATLFGLGMRQLFLCYTHFYTI